MSDGERMESALDERIDRALRDGISSTPEARARIMEAVHASARPVAGGGHRADLVVEHASPAAMRPFWRSPSMALLAAASIAGVIALVHAVGVVGPIPVVPGQAPVRESHASVATVAQAATGPSTATIGAAATRVAKVQFVLVAPKARKVVVVGDFNDWDPTVAPLTPSGAVWSREVEVPYGRHDYAFVVDGDTWLRDPGAPRAPADEFGNGYSVLVVGEHR